MSEGSFAIPVVALLPVTKNGPVLKALTSPCEGIDAICRFGLGLESAAYVEVLEKLVAAAVCPTPNNVEAAQHALEELASDRCRTRLPQ